MSNCHCLLTHPRNHIHTYNTIIFIIFYFLRTTLFILIYLHFWFIIIIVYNYSILAVKISLMLTIFVHEIKILMNLIKNIITINEFIIRFFLKICILSNTQYKKNLISVFFLSFYYKNYIYLIFLEHF